MTSEEITERVNNIIKVADDPEVAHSEEDELMVELVKEYAPDYIISEIERLQNADFPRWCA